MDASASSPPVKAPPTTRDLRLYMEGLAVLQVLMLIGLVALFLQIDGVPDRTAIRVPDTGGIQADAAIGPMGSDVTELRVTVNAMAAQIDAICAVVADKVPAAVSPNPCSLPTPTRAP